MKGRLLFAAGAAVGYVLGTKAGRERYEQLVRAARAVRGNPAVRQATESIERSVGQMKESAKRTASAKANSMAYNPPRPPSSDGHHPR